MASQFGMVQRMHKFRIYPSRKQTARLFYQLDVCKIVYNELLALSMAGTHACGDSASTSRLGKRHAESLKQELYAASPEEKTLGQ